MLSAGPLALYDSDTNSDTLIHFWGEGENYLLTKKKSLLRSARRLLREIRERTN
jgi:hypothetical protein